MIGRPSCVQVRTELRSLALARGPMSCTSWLQVWCSCRTCRGVQQVCCGWLLVEQKSSKTCGQQNCRRVITSYMNALADNTAWASSSFLAPCALLQPHVARHLTMYADKNITPQALDCTKRQLICAELRTRSLQAQQHFAAHLHIYPAGGAAAAAAAGGGCCCLSLLLIFSAAAPLPP
jgi:hypothetical protein